jgi:hypothetical protein
MDGFTGKEARRSANEGFLMFALLGLGSGMHMHLLRLGEE